MLREEVCSDMKRGGGIPIPKKLKNRQKMENYRGITISSTVCKVFEIVILKKCGTIPQVSMQFGFTSGLSPLMAAVCLTEAVNESRSAVKNLY